MGEFMDYFSFDDLEQVLSTIPKEIKQQKLSVLLPHYNEKNIIANINIIVSLLKKWNWNFEIIVSDDGSSDSDLIMQGYTSIKELKIVQSFRNYGKGRALVTAYEESVGEYILFLDSDLELSLEHLPYFMKQMLDTNVDIVIGSKEAKGSQLEYPFIRKFFSFVYATIIKILFGMPVKDTQTGIKLFKRKALESTLPYLLVKRFAFDVELLALCHYQGFRIASHPIVLQYTRSEDLGRMTIDTIIHMFKDTLAIFWRLKSGFWKNINVKKKSLKYVVISTSVDITVYSGDVYHIKNTQEIPSLLEQLTDYDVVIFLNKQEELPVFMHYSLDRIFADDNIKGVFPLLYPLTNNIEEELYYSIIGNIFCPHGCYPHYRPVKQKFIGSVPLYIHLESVQFVFRRSYLEEIINSNEGKFPKNILDCSQIVHTPYFYIHQQFPRNFNEYKDYLLKNTCRVMGVKKWMRNLYLFTALLFVIGIFEQSWIYSIPWIFLEIGLHFWYIYSLGIRKGVRYLWLFDRIRLYNVFYNFICVFVGIKKIIKK